MFHWPWPISQCFCHCGFLFSLHIYNYTDWHEQQWTITFWQSGPILWRSTILGFHQQMEFAQLPWRWLYGWNHSRYSTWRSVSMTTEKTIILLAITCAIDRSVKEAALSKLRSSMKYSKMNPQEKCKIKPRQLVQAFVLGWWLGMTYMIQYWNNNTALCLSVWVSL